jgi:hypothetical protein
MSGLIQCHGFDQGALQLLMLATLVAAKTKGTSISAARSSKKVAMRGSGFSTLYDDPRPFGYRCEWMPNIVKNWKGKGEDWEWKGCNPEGDWSCDSEYERALFRAGYKAPSARFFGDAISSWSKGCANDDVPLFHIITETPTAPRLQCFHCGGTLTEPRPMYGAQASLLFGDLGGGNFRMMNDGAMGSWLVGHKGESWFYQRLYNQTSCAKPAFKFPPPCRVEGAIASLHDGVAFDSIRHIYCSLGAEGEMAKAQLTREPARKYTALIAAAKVKGAKVAEQYNREQMEWVRGWNEYFDEKGAEYQAEAKELGAAVLQGDALKKKLIDGLYEKPGFCQACKRTASGAIDCDLDEEG